MIQLNLLYFGESTEIIDIYWETNAVVVGMA